MKLHPKVLAKNGRKEFVVLPYEEYQALRERLADAEDLAALRKAIREDDPSQPGMSLPELKKHLGLTKKPVQRQRSRRKRS